MERTNRIAVVEAMRGLASVGVVLFHCTGQMVSDIPRMILDVGWLGVDVFFVISGFVIPLSLYGRDYRVRDFPNFLLRRLVRLEPPYLVSIGLAILLGHLSAMTPGFRGTDPVYSLPQVAFHFLYAIPLTNYSWLSPVYWSLAYEFVFYILVGLAFSSLINRAIEFTILFVGVVAAALFYLQSGFDVKVLEFAVGILVMRFIVADGSDRLRIGIYIAACLAIVFWTGGVKAGTAVLLAATAILFLRDFEFGRWAIFLGGISYSLYLTHVLIGGRVINIGRRFGEGAIFELFLIVVALAVSILFAMLFARWIEVPATNASRRIGSLPAKAA
jgi:peptidoglycan/LPS O-acetylase OafA/YrhL